MAYCWSPVLTTQTWPERVASLRQRAAALGLFRIGDDLYTDVRWVEIVRVSETDQHMLFPGEEPSDKPHFHGMRPMTQAEVDAMYPPN